MGAPHELYEPRTPFVRDFLGKVAVLEGVVAAAPGPLEVAVRLNETGEVLVSRALPDGPAPGVGEAASLAIRPEHIPVEPATESREPPNSLAGGGGSALFMGQVTEARVMLAGGRSVLVPLRRCTNYARGSRCGSNSRRST